MAYPIYEWIVEELMIDDSMQDDPDIVDITHCDSYNEAETVVKRLQRLSIPARIALTRDDEDGREWAYMKAGMLPEHFETPFGSIGNKVPNKFHKEVCDEA